MNDFRQAPDRPLFFLSAVLRLTAAITLLSAALTFFVQLIGPVASGQLIAFQVSDQARRDIYVGDVDRSLFHNLTRAMPGDSYAPAWSPAGWQIAFASRSGDDLQIYVADMENNRFWQATTGAGGKTFPVWSPDGGHIAYISYQTGTGEIFVMDAQGGHPTQVTQGDLINDPPLWSPDGGEILFRQQVGPCLGYIFAVGADGLGRHQIVGDENVMSMNLSPDGQHILFTSTSGGQMDIYRVDMDGANLMRLSQSYAVDDFAAWSPNHDHIAFVSNREGATDLYLMGADGGDVFQLTDGIGVANVPAWSPNGQYVAVFSNRSGREHIYVVDASSGAVRQLTSGDGSYAMPAWKAS